MAKKSMLERCTRISLDKFTTPEAGDVVMTDRWWIVVDGDVLFFEGRAPQCNSRQDIAEHLRDKLYPGADVKYIPVGYRKRRVRGASGPVSAHDSDDDHDDLISTLFGPDGE